MNELLEYGEKALKEKNLDPSLASYLYKYIGDMSRYKVGIKKIIEGIPVQYIVGNVNFYGYLFNVNSHVLIPRFETEELVQKTLNYIRKYMGDGIDIVDVGTGSGCIAITLKCELAQSHVSAVDISQDALDVANDNAKINNAIIHFCEGDMLEPLTTKYDLIISNPPYIASDEEVMEIVKNNEPHIALYAEEDGLRHYRKILSEAAPHLKPRSMIALEIGESQGERIKEIALSYFPNAIIKVEQDMQERDRFIFIFNQIDC